MRAAGFVVAALLASACGDGVGQRHAADADQIAVFDVDIDTDARIDVSSGDGAGVFVEYAAGGDWELFTTCDTNLSDIPCEFDILVSVPLGERISNVDGLELERDDEVFSLERGVLSLFFLTASDFDRVQFRTSPGQTVRIDALVDGVPDPEIMFWNGYGALQFAAPSNPLDLTPSEP